MTGLIIINPDDFLGSPRVWTAERGKIAWASSYEKLEAALAASAGKATLYIVCGLQGAGKSRWIARNPDYFDTPAIIFDAALPAARHRAPALELARRHACPAKAVWICTPLETALIWNRQRPADQQVPDEAIVSVSGMMEEPGVAEGFVGVERVSS